jgi:hypothetical protein
MAVVGLDAERTPSRSSESTRHGGNVNAGFNAVPQPAVQSFLEIHVAPQNMLGLVNHHAGKGQESKQVCTTVGLPLCWRRKKMTL